MKKNQARKKYKAFRNKLSNLKIKKLSNQIFQQSLKLKIWNKDTYMLYRPIKAKKEVDAIAYPANSVEPSKIIPVHLVTI